MFEKRLGRFVALRLQYEGDSDAVRSVALVFQGVESFRCAYYHARSDVMLEAYDRLVDLGPSAWLQEVTSQLLKHRSPVDGLRHLAINFDDGPAYEVLCRSFLIEAPLSG